MAELKSIANQAKDDVSRIESSLSERLEALERLMRYYSSPDQSVSGTLLKLSSLFVFTRLNIRSFLTREHPKRRQYRGGITSCW